MADDDRIIGAHLTDGLHHVLLASAGGMAIRFDENDIRAMGRNARGVKGMNLADDDRVVSALVLEPESENALLTVCENGYGKRTPASEYRAQSRAGKGLITIKVTERNGEVVAMLEVSADDQIMVVTDQSKVIRTPVDQISEQGRNTQGVRIIRMRDEEKVAAVSRILDSSDAESGEAQTPEGPDAEDAPEDEAGSESEDTPETDE